MRSLRYRIKGSVSVMTALTITVLVGFLGLAVDLGRLFVIRSELQTAMDACALAAAPQLQRGLILSDALSRAVAHGQSLPNRVDFQRRPLQPDRIQIRFSDRLEGPFEPAQAFAGTNRVLPPRFVQCSYPLEDIPVLFMRAVSALTEVTVAASAIATLDQGQTSCVFPTAVCRDASGPPWVGDWIFNLGGPGANSSGPEGCGSGTGRGNFCWLSFGGGGARSLAEVVAGRGECNLRSDTVVSRQGINASVVDAWNARFGIYSRQAYRRGEILTVQPPDRTGYAYTEKNWPSGSNAFADYVQRRRDHARFNPGLSDSGINLGGSNTTIISSAEHARYGRNRRLVVAPVIDCNGFSSTDSNVLPVEFWACMLLLAPITQPGGGGFSSRMEYLGPADRADSPCSTQGLAGGTGPLVPVLAQ